MTACKSNNPQGLRLINCQSARDESTIGVLRALLDLAYKGEVRGLAMAYLTPSGDRFAVTGAYRARDDLGIAAAQRLAWRLTGNAEEDES